MSWQIRERLMGDLKTKETFTFQCSHSLGGSSSDMHPSFDDLAFCANTFGRGGHAMIMGTGDWFWNDQSRWIYQRNFIAFRSQADMLVFLMMAA